MFSKWSTSTGYVQAFNFWKAFYTLGYSALLQKVSTYDVKDKELEGFNSYLFNKKKHVCVDENISAPELVYCGFSKGSILGPSLFIIFINDLNDYIKHVSVIMYAFNIVLHENKEKSQDDLNQDMQNLLPYFRKNEFVINLKREKTETMLFGTTKRLKTAS